MISVVIPCFKVKKHILDVIEGIGPEVKKIYIIDDCCPEKSGAFAQENSDDERVQVLFHEVNQGVGGAVMTGYKKSVEDGCKIAVKIDGDGQMDPKLLPQFIAPILNGEADYTKGNRFYYIEGLKDMPFIRIFGNSALSFINKVVSGYWNIMDPTNGYTAIHTDAIRNLPLEKISKRYFFESDMLFRLNTNRSVVKDIPMHGVYEDEESNLSIKKVLFSFPPKYINRTFKRIFYNYFLRDFNIGSITLILGLLFCSFGFVFGTYHWILAGKTGTNTPLGTIMVASLPLILGFQTLLFFLQQDVNSVPTTCTSTKILDQ